MNFPIHSEKNMKKNLFDLTKANIYVTWKQSESGNFTRLFDTIFHAVSR